MESPKNNSVFGRFSSLPPRPPASTMQILVIYCRLAVSEAENNKIASRGCSYACFEGSFWRVFENNLRKLTFKAKDSLKLFLGSLLGQEKGT